MIRKPFFILIGLGLSYWAACQSPAANLRSIAADFVANYPEQDISWVDFDYREYLRGIPGTVEIDRHAAFFEQYQQRLAKVPRPKLTTEERLLYDHLAYQIGVHLQRFQLEKLHRNGPADALLTDGLYQVPNGKQWYAFLAKYATGVDLSPQAMHEYGRAEVAKIQREIRSIRARLGFDQDSLGFLRHLNEPQFFLTDRDSIVAAYRQKKATVLEHLSSMFEQAPAGVPDIEFMTWPNAGPYTPPGIYLSADNNAYGKAVFQYNFYGGRHNRRAMDWLFMHEAIPGHHFHRHVRGEETPADLGGLFFAGGTVEGWATYVEYFGAEMGLYRDDYAWLGKWEWDLVRSVRVVISTGIHYYGWSKEKALDYWKTNVPNQDDIAEREITRCINWPAQVLTYKIGAKAIFELRDQTAKREGAAFDLRRFHTRFLMAGYIPLAVLEKQE